MITCLNDIATSCVQQSVADPAQLRKRSLVSRSVSLREDRSGHDSTKWEVQVYHNQFTITHDESNDVLLGLALDPQRGSLPVSHDTGSNIHT